jgi:hypothetical protein
MSTTSCDDCHDWEAGGFGMGIVSTTAHCNMCLVRPNIGHIKRLLEEACPNHAYPSGTSSRTMA